LTPVACNDDSSAGSSAVEVRFRANTTYFIAISTCCSLEANYGGNAVLRLYIPQAFTLSAPVVSSQAGDVSGRAFVTGTFRCSNPGFISLQIVISQRNGPFVARGSGYFGSECGRVRQEWTVQVDTDTGYAFRPGQASVTVDGYAADGFDTTSSTTTQVVTLEAAPTAAPARAG